MTTQALGGDECSTAEHQGALEVDVLEKPDPQFIAAVVEQSKQRCRMRLRQVVPRKRRSLADTTQDGSLRGADFV
jgi:hypothetical protein